MRWRRLDVPGADECRLSPIADGWRVTGIAEFAHHGQRARLAYAVECDPVWRTTHGAVSGTIGAEPFSLTARRDGSDAWTVDGRPAPALAGLVDLDLGFTPATNLFPLRRLALAPGEAADAEAVWLDDADWCLKRLPQRYERRDATTYQYDSPSVGYAGLVRVNPEGFVLDYPGLWRAAD